MGIEFRRDGRQRVLIEGIAPQVGGGMFAAKAVTGDEFVVEADIFSDGHDTLSAVVQFRPGGTEAWSEAPMVPQTNDRWRGSFLLTHPGRWEYKIVGWIDRFKTWRRELEKKRQAGVDVSVELESGAFLIKAAAGRAPNPDKAELATAAASIGFNSALPVASQIPLALSGSLFELMSRYSDRSFASESDRAYEVMVEPVLARFGAWYEFFPRSCARAPGQHGTFRDCEALLPRIAKMGFDIIYLPPIHPIGRSFRKGKNNRPQAEPGEPGSPWGIGASEGGHKSIHPQLGTIEDFRHFVAAAERQNLKVALDIAFQCSPDHPYVKDHPEWFRHRPDGAIQYAENPPKKYQDIYPINFETQDWPNLWLELKSIFDFWIEQGVHILRVDNPHTKAFHFWEWVIRELKKNQPGLIFLSEAFTRPKLMYYLAKAGFTQSYNYFPWRNTKQEITSYLTEITQSDLRHYFRPNLWPNTPDILTEYLQFGGKPAFMARLILAATLGASYGIYGPAFELCENKPREPGSEEYLDSEKYEIRVWNLDAPGNLAELIGKVNRIRRENPALQSNDSLRFHPIDNDQLIAYTKQSRDGENIILTVVNVDPHHVQRGWLRLSMEEFGLRANETFQAHELLTNARYLWSSGPNFIELDPNFVPAHIFRLRRKIRTEHDFDYFA